MKSKKWLLFIIAAVALSGCSAAKEKNTEQDFEEKQYKEDDLFNINETLTEEKLQGVQENPEEMENNETMEYVAYDAANRYRSETNERDMQSLFCIDPATGVIYFVNQNKDWYIYRLVNGEAELAVELPARELYALNGTVYFILEDYNRYALDDFTEGDIYAYTPKDGSVKKVLSALGLESEINHMQLYEDGIAFSCRKETEANGLTSIESFYYYYNFADEKLETDPYRRAYPGWGDYYLIPAYTSEGWKSSLWSRTNYHKEVLDLNVPATNSFIMQDTMYSCSRSEYFITDIITGEQQIFDCDALFKEMSPVYGAALKSKVVINGFTVTKDYLWAVIFNQSLLKINPVNGDAVCYVLEGNGMINDLYTDGINLYATYSKNTANGTWKGGSLVRICTEETVGQHAEYKVPLLAVEYVTE